MEFILSSAYELLSILFPTISANLSAIISTSSSIILSSPSSAISTNATFLSYSKHTLYWHSISSTTTLSSSSKCNKPTIQLNQERFSENIKFVANLEKEKNQKQWQTIIAYEKWMIDIFYLYKCISFIKLNFF